MHPERCLSCLKGWVLPLTETIFGGGVACPAGFCKLHNGALSVKQIRKKDCLQKECWHFRKNSDHPWWRQRELYAEFR